MQEHFYRTAIIITLVASEDLDVLRRLAQSEVEFKPGKSGVELGAQICNHRGAFRGESLGLRFNAQCARYYPWDPTLEQIFGVENVVATKTER